MQKGGSGLIIIYAVVGLFLISQTMIISVNLIPSIIEDPFELKTYRKSLLHALVFSFGLFAAFWISRIDYRKLLKPALVYLALSVGLVSLLVVLLKKLISGKNVERWLFGSSVQPLEFVKISLIVFLAYYISSKGSLRKFGYFLWVFSVIVLHALLLFLQPDKGGALFVSFLSLSMVYVAGMSRKAFAIIVIFGILACPSL
ncbi:MAG: FtsW/RodA/SpoVE family cell cycle protein [Aquificaceae bacterium]|nr:FtsW/RodA/SpoVE family cell cycle protein [Aquificaceae bacterium]MDW8237380.1 FtsW/RodA/SpoVE family cell cycle protein [Aquificaceae bacterium]